LIEDRTARGASARATATALSIYAAFLVSFHEGNHRKAFDLLFAAEAVHQEAKAFGRRAEESQWAADDL